MARKKAAHHGGAWKVAYADFVTAMMALFMVLWISAQDEEIKLATSEYFQKPFHSPVDATSGVLPFNSSRATRVSLDSPEASRTNQVKMTFLNTVAADFYRLLHLDESLADKPIDIQVTTDGLRVTLFDKANRPLFVEDTTELTEWGSFVMQNMAWIIDRHKFMVTIDGHARSSAGGQKENYSGWELSADRANAARRSLVYYAVDSARIERVVGYADTKPLPGEGPDSESNQRITLNLTLTSKARFKDSKLVEEPIPVIDTNTTTETATATKPAS